MKKIALFLLIFMMSVVGKEDYKGALMESILQGVSYGDQPVAAPENDGAVVQTKITAPLFSKKVLADPVPILVEEPVVEESHYCDDIPLTHEEQDWLQDACEEFDIPYALALGLIEKETRFQNLVGDNGASTGYMQIQQKWHWDRMERLGVTDLLEPSGNFRVGCDFLAELYAKYNDWNVALTVYNMGHDPGYITDYAKDVIGNYVRWQEIIDNYV